MSNILSHFNTVVIGGGQAGLAMGYYLSQYDRDFIILDAHEQIGDTWRRRRDSLRLFTQARYSNLPGLSFPAPDDHFPTKDEMADYLEMYATQFDLPVCLETKVESLTRNGDRYVLDTGSQPVSADHVVVATGGFQQPKVPDFNEELDSSITQLHSSVYRNPDQLPEDDIVVVGAGNSGAEIAKELVATGRHTFLSGRDTGHIPLDFFNSRVFWWLASTVLTADTWACRKIKEYSQSHGDPLIRFSSEDLRQTEIRRVPRVEGVVNGKPYLNNDRVLDVVAVVWATGFYPDYSWIEVPRLKFDETGYPVHDRGVADGPAELYFLGLPYQSTLVSASIGGVGADAKYIANYLVNMRESSQGGSNDFRWEVSD